jgi:multidrug efflux pump subunit AcrA (membrane-fusion protein)
VTEDPWINRLAQQIITRHPRAIQSAGFALGILGLFVSAISLVLSVAISHKSPTQPQLEAELAATFETLQQDSAKATALLQRLQSELQQRTKAAQQIEAELNELQKQRKLLNLTSEQKEALQSLVRRQLTASEIVTSLDFWLGRVLPAAVFFLFGIFFTLLFSRRFRVSVTSPPPANHQLVPAHSAQEKPPQRT